MSLILSEIGQKKRLFFKLIENCYIKYTQKSKYVFFCRPKNVYFAEL